MAVSRTSKGTKGAAERKALEIEWRKHVVAKRLLEGKAKGEIARELGIHPSQISRLRRETEEQYVDRYLADTMRFKAQELAKIDYREKVCWEQFYLSCRLRRQDTQFTDAEGDSTVTTTLAGRAELNAQGKSSGLKDEVGDPRWIAEIRSCSEQRCELMGLNVKVPVALTPHYFDKFNAEEIQRLADGEALWIVERDCDERNRVENMRRVAPEKGNGAA